MAPAFFVERLWLSSGRCLVPIFEFISSVWVRLEGFTIQGHCLMCDRKSTELVRQIIRYLNTRVSPLSFSAPVWLPFRVSLFCWRNMSTESVIRSLYFQFDAWRYSNTILLLVLFLVQCFSSVIRLLRLAQTHISHRGLSRSAVRNRQRFSSFASFVLFWSCVSQWLLFLIKLGLHCSKGEVFF